MAGLVLLGLAAGVRLVTTNRVVRSRVRLTIALSLIFIGINAALASPALLQADSQGARRFGQPAPLRVRPDPVPRARAGEPAPRGSACPSAFRRSSRTSPSSRCSRWWRRWCCRRNSSPRQRSVPSSRASRCRTRSATSYQASPFRWRSPSGSATGSGWPSGKARSSEITWRAVKVRTRDGNEVIIPNGELAKSALVNYSEPASPTRIYVEVGASYEDAPNTVREVMLEAMRREPLVLKVPVPHVHLVEFAGSSVNYRAYFWIERLPQDEEAKDRVRTAIYYAFKRHGISIPFPIQVQYNAETPASGQATRTASAGRSCSLRRICSACWRRRIATGWWPRRACTSSATARRSSARTSPANPPTSSATGASRVTLDPGNVELAVLNAGAYFGEMSLLTGDARTATVRSVGDCRVLEITAGEFRARDHGESGAARKNRRGGRQAARGDCAGPFSDRRSSCRRIRDQPGRSRAAFLRRLAARQVRRPNHADGRTLARPRSAYADGRAEVLGPTTRSQLPAVAVLAIAFVVPAQEALAIRGDVLLA